LTSSALVVGALPAAVGVVVYLAVLVLGLRLALRWAREAAGEPE
jgi:hypothetical protein